MIEAIPKGAGPPRVRAICDGCGKQDVIPCGYGPNERGGKHPNYGQAIRKMLARNWAEVKGRLLCQTCDAKRRATSLKGGNSVKTTKDSKPGSSVSQIRQPTPAQEVDIIVMLSSVYDRKAKCYAGSETDRSVAETIGGGVMPGWVAAIREEKFGPAGNEEIAMIRAEIARLETVTAKLKARVDACVAAHDKRVGGAA